MEKIVHWKCVSQTTVSVANAMAAESAELGGRYGGLDTGTHFYDSQHYQHMLFLKHTLK